ncbi:hypothetical protein NY78_1164 [Desulfovibrio sp. TomC]|nr:hypothetical protein NY78_1164 [Desulfovibrio sp. TomC]
MLALAGSRDRGRRLEKDRAAPGRRLGVYDEACPTVTAALWQPTPPESPASRGGPGRRKRPMRPVPPGRVRVIRFCTYPGKQPGRFLFSSKIQSHH